MIPFGVNLRCVRFGVSEGDLRALQAEVDELRAELETVRGRLGEVDEIHSRLDFAERMLAAKEKGALPGAR